ncbi:MAG: drug/metabolite transporter (DMT)-like permease [Candidatus Azotimanducaceae bacterium]|jgi:drug/metabolite transporter (DMT)-like permease
MKNRPEHIQGLIFACLGALALTPDGLLVRLAGVSDLNIVFWRGFLIAVALFLVQLIQHRRQVFKAVILRSRKEWAAAVFAALGTTTFVLAITHTTVANVLVILSTMSLFSALLSMIFLKERIAFRTWLAMFAAIVGIIIVFMDDLNGLGLSGKLFALGCAFMTSATMTLIRSDKSIKIPAVYIWSGLMVAIPCFFLSTSSLAIDMNTGFIFIVMAGLNAIAFVLLAAGAKLIPSPEVSLLMLLETIIGPIWVWFVLTETPSTNALIGGSIVVATLALHSIASHKAQKHKL